MNKDSLDNLGLAILYGIAIILTSFIVNYEINFFFIFLSILGLLLILDLFALIFYILVAIKEDKKLRSNDESR